MNMTREARPVMFLDPGLFTGWARLGSDDVFSSGEAILQQTGHVVANHCISHEDALVGYERFDIGPKTYQMKGASTAIETIGVIRWHTAEHGGTLLPPSPRDAKDAIDDKLLKALGWYRIGHGGHANDAARHLVVWLRDHGMMPRREKEIMRKFLQDKALTY